MFYLPICAIVTHALLCAQLQPPLSVEVNREFQHTFGYSSEELGQHMQQDSVIPFRLVVPSEWPRLLLALLRLMLGVETNVRLAVTCRTKVAISRCFSVSDCFRAVQTARQLGSRRARVQRQRPRPRFQLYGAAESGRGA